MSPRNGHGTHHRTRHGRRFRNNYPHDRHGLRQFLKFLWGFQRQEYDRPPFPKAPNDPAALRENRTLPTLTWVGHDTFLLQAAGLNILTDPHFTKRTSPVNWAGPERLAPLGLALKDLPPIDLVLISHNHYDHLDERTVKWLSRHNPDALFIVPLGVKRWFQRRRLGNTIELDWWQAHVADRFKVTAVPVQHFSGRTATDRNRTLWCGFVLEIAGKKLFFAGDSGYSKDFADIGAAFAPFDLALIPIGAYEPRWFMRAMHVNPEEAVRIHRDVGAKQSVAMHWGTFRLTEEPLDEPPKHLAIALKDAGIPADEFWVMQHGETRPLTGIL
jgi:N-acyl-phosphatidylethanolamine-hydrolysing phospholipase D